VYVLGTENGVITFSLQSGSNGNSIYVEADGVSLLFDAGISGRQARLRMESHGRDIRAVDALLITHDHTDHVRCAGIYQRLFGLPIYMTEDTYHAAAWQLGKAGDIRHFHAGESLSFGPVTVHTHSTAHDAADGVTFIVECRHKRLGIFTDLGHPFEGLAEQLESVDAAYLESNYDPLMLEEGPYPPDLKRRIRGPGGHLSNEESAELARLCAGRHAWIALAHLSEQNNHPSLALGTHRRIAGHDQHLTVAGRYDVSRLLRL
jgi:phosphoribosyl 1,2-cyclic phosphodiesterase